MDSAKDIKVAITATVTKYELNNPVEFSQFLEGRRAKTDTLHNKFAAARGTDVIERLLLEMPETLDHLLASLGDDAKAFMKSREGALWFARSFKAYTVPDKI
jgi:hypothetical protein